VAEWLYGRHAVEEALRAGRRRVFRVLLVESPPGKKGDAQTGRLAAIERAAREARVSLERVPASRLDALTKVWHHHQGVAAEVAPFRYASLPEVVEMCRAAGQSALVLILDSIQDPQNFGTLLRTADAVGATAVVMLDRRQVEVTPAVVNASAGAVEHLQVCLANNLPRAIETLQEAGLWIYALQAEPGGSPIFKSDLRGALGLVVGSEGQGVGRLVRERCDGALSLPMVGKVESLNAAVAGSVALYEILRQRTHDNP
jgi:23S rRNA (guanosine2251-2'-O)-methyltransferase